MGEVHSGLTFHQSSTDIRFGDDDLDDVDARIVHVSRGLRFGLGI